MLDRTDPTPIRRRSPRPTKPLVEQQGRVWGVTVEAGCVVTILTEQQEWDARSDAFALQALRFFDRIEHEPHNAVELARLGKQAQVNAILFDQREDECRVKALGHVSKIKAIARQCSDWVQTALGGKTADERALGRGQG